MLMKLSYTTINYSKQLNGLPGSRGLGVPASPINLSTYFFFPQVFHSFLKLIYLPALLPSFLGILHFTYFTHSHQKYIRMPCMISIQFLKKYSPSHRRKTSDSCWFLGHVGLLRHLFFPLPLISLRSKLDT